MTELIQLVVVFAGLLVVYALTLGGVGGRIGGRVGRPPRGVATRLRDPSGGGLAATLLATLAIGALASDSLGSRSGLPAGAGASIGFILAVLLGLRWTRPATGAALSLLGFVAALVAGVRFVFDAEQGPSGQAYRGTLALLLLVCFLSSAVLFRRKSALAGARGLALFGLMDVLIFLAGPAGAQLYDLSAGRHLLYLVVVCASAFALGWAVSEFTLGLAAITVAVTTFGLGLVGLAPSTHALENVSGVVAAVVCFVLATAGLRRLRMA